MWVKHLAPTGTMLMTTSLVTLFCPNTPESHHTMTHIGLLPEHRISIDESKVVNNLQT